MKSRVHPKYKSKYRVSNWGEDDRGLVERGDISLWISHDAGNILNTMIALGAPESFAIAD